MSRHTLKLETLALLFSIALVCASGCSNDSTGPAGTQGQFKIAFNSIRNGHTVIVTMNADGTNQQQLTSDTASVYGYPEFSPDGKKIMYVAGDKDVYTMNADGTGKTFLADANGDDWDERPIWLPNGRILVLQGGLLMNADGSNQEVISPSVTGRPAFSGDGRKIAFVTATGPDMRQLFVVNMDGTNRQQLTQDTGYDNKGYPAWSPDGKTIAFRSQRDGDDEIYTINADGTNLSRLSNNLESDDYPSWSPDGTRILFVRSDSIVFVMNRDGSNQRKVVSSTPDGRDFPSVLSPFPRWSPDGATIVFVSLQSGGTIFSINPDGTNQQRLTSGFDMYPAWSPVRFP
jgi:TolB protein